MKLRADFPWPWCAVAPLITAVVAKAQDPFGEPATPIAAAAGAAADAAASCAQLSEAMCTSANQTFLFMAGGYVLVCLVICVVWTLMWSGRGAGQGLLKFALPLVVGAMITAAAVGFDPFASDNYLCCIADPTFRVSLLLGESRIARAIVAGLIPFSVLYLISVFIVKVVRK